MPTFNMTALPGHHEKHPSQGYTSTIVELLGQVLGRGTVEAKSVDEIKGLVRQFGEAVAAQHPEHSFMVSITIAKGSRKPRGFDEANRRNGLGQETWMRTVEKANYGNPSLAA